MADHCADPHDHGPSPMDADRADRQNNFMAMWQDGPVSILLALAFMGALWAIAILTGEPRETGLYPDSVRRTAELCPAISDRVDEMLADGRVTADEKSVVSTLRDQARAALGGLANCHID